MLASGYRLLSYLFFTAKIECFHCLMSLTALDLDSQPTHLAVLCIHITPTVWMRKGPCTNRSLTSIISPYSACFQSAPLIAEQCVSNSGTCQLQRRTYLPLCVHCTNNEFLPPAHQYCELIHANAQSTNVLLNEIGLDPGWTLFCPHSPYLPRSVSVCSPL
ncbi:hypothetical protein SCLCIDRAFT_1036796 [Scleroderma citrinum Foug A]|uniref:Uncharacterized protein n=1 Tax=Scleroderma citrinum Foug A TaxID=1036808 RepID=A0A0C3DEW3_9AGAM|nr:hypothetical protein SCLCIDRAFT_1036796 [Scleroderma citrinum Foug A]